MKSERTELERGKSNRGGDEGRGGAGGMGKEEGEMED